jgi:hypothetical protein
MSIPAFIIHMHTFAMTICSALFCHTVSVHSMSVILYRIDLCFACLLLTYDWSVDLSFALPLELWTIGYCLFVAVDKHILSLWDYNLVWRSQTCCLINFNLYNVIYKFVLIRCLYFVYLLFNLSRSTRHHSLMSRCLKNTIKYVNDFSYLPRKIYC